MKVRSGGSLLIALINMLKVKNFFKNPT